MDTTQTESGENAAPVEHAKVAGHSRWWLGPAGFAAALPTFLFGGFFVLSVIPFLLPPLRRWRTFAYGLFVGVLVLRGLMLLGVNPVVSYAQSRIVDRLQTALGGEVSYESASGDAVSGRFEFEGLRVELPELEGYVEVADLSVDAGYFLLHRPDGVRISGSGFTAVLDADQGRLEKWLESRERPGDETIHIALEEGGIVVGGGVGAGLTVNRVVAEAGPEGWTLHLGIREAVILFRGRSHTFEVYGGLSAGDSGDGLNVEVDLRAIEPELGHGVVRGSLRPGGGTYINCTIDALNLQALWARYRKVDEYGGTCRGNVRISGELNELMLELDLGVEDYSYYHTTAMGLDRTHAFQLPEGRITGRVVLVEGKELVFQDVMLVTEDATLSTGERMNARGRGMVVLNGIAPKFTGRLEAVVESGEINQPITWSKEQDEGLEDVTPNIVIVGEQFSNLDMSWELEVKQMTVKASPLSGTMSGKLSGTFLKQDGARVGKLRAQGELSMEDGKVDCLGLQGDFTGKLTFNPTAPTRHASLRGEIRGALGDTKIDCEVTGEVSRPGFVFKGMTMSPEALGRKLYRYSPSPLTERKELERRNQCMRIFGAYAASKENPFEARSSGKVFFGFR